MEELYLHVFNRAPEQLGEFVLNLVIASLIYIVGSLLLRYFLRLVQRLLTKKSHDVTVNGFIELVLHIGLKFVLLVLVLAQLGINTNSLLALLGAAGLAVGLAVKDSLSNFASGVMLIALKPFKVGEYIEAASSAGTVEKISLFSTILITGDNKKVIVPNAQIYRGTITNYSAMPRRRLDVHIDLHHDSCLASAKALLLEAAQAEARVLEEPKAIVVVTDITELGVKLMCRVWVKTSDYWKVKWALLEAFKLTLDEHDIELAKQRIETHSLKTSEK